MNKVIAALLVLPLIGATACKTAPAGSSGTGSQLAGAPSPRLAAERFLDAVRANDLRAMSLIWGTSKGPARNNMDPNELEKREIIIQCFYNHDKFRILSDLPGDAGAKGERIVRVELTRGKISKQPFMYVVQGPGERWYVREVDMKSVKGFCN